MKPQEAIVLLESLKLMFSNEKGEAVSDVYYALDMAIKALKQGLILDKVKAEITDCLNALDELEESGLNIYLPNETSGRRLTYYQCLEFIDKYKAESEE